MERRRRGALARLEHARFQGGDRRPDGGRPGCYAAMRPVASRRTVRPAHARARPPSSSGRFSGLLRRGQLRREAGIRALRRGRSGRRPLLPDDVRSGGPRQRYCAAGRVLQLVMWACASHSSARAAVSMERPFPAAYQRSGNGPTGGAEQEESRQPVSPITEASTRPGSSSALVRSCRRPRVRGAPVPDTSRRRAHARVKNSVRRPGFAIQSRPREARPARPRTRRPLPGCDR